MKTTLLLCVFCIAELIFFTTPGSSQNFNPKTVVDSVKKQYNVTAAFDYHGAFGSGGGVLMGVRAQYLIINTPNFSFGLGAEYHQTISDYVAQHLDSYNSYDETNMVIKGSDELQLIGGVFSFRYKFKGDKIQKYLETGMGYDFNAFPVYESVSTSREYQNSWYDNSTSTSYLYSYKQSDHVTINFKGLSSLRVGYGFAAKATSNLDFFCDFGLAYYHGTYRMHREVEQIITSGTPPPSGLVYGPYYPYNYPVNSLTVVAFNVSFGVQF